MNIDVPRDPLKSLVPTMNTFIDAFPLYIYILEHKKCLMFGIRYLKSDKCHILLGTYTIFGYNNKLHGI